MNRGDFQSGIHGKLAHNLAGQLTFVPLDLPGPVSLDWELLGALATAERALGRLVGVGQTLPDPRLVVHSSIRREAELSSRIENTYAQFSDLVLFEQIPSIEAAVPDVREVHNNELALSYGLSSVQEHGREIGIPLIKEMHELLLRGVRGSDKQPGQFRSIQVFIGRSPRIEDARFVPAPPGKVPELMEKLAEFIRSRGNLSPIIRAAMAHYQFEAIHPFADGNGRIGRVLILLMLCADKALPLPLLNPSSFLESQREEYYQRLLEVSLRGSWAEWVKFFIQGITSAANEALERIDRLKSLQAEYREKLQTARSSALLLKLVDELFINQAIGTARAAQVLNVTYLSAQRSIEKLVAAGILREVTGRQRNRVYIADGIVQAVSHGGGGS